MLTAGVFTKIKAQEKRKKSKANKNYLVLSKRKNTLFSRYNAENARLTAADVIVAEYQVPPSGCDGWQIHLEHNNN